MNVFYQYADVGKLTPKGGDLINEMNFVDALSKFSNVRYGLRRRRHDVYFVRGNARLFLKLPHPKIWMASPFVRVCYQEADMIATFTEEWAKRIRAGNDFEWIPERDRKKYYNARNISQAVADQFVPLRTHPVTQSIREKMGGGFIIGHFGRIVRSNHPTALVSLTDKLKKDGVKIIFGSGKGQLNSVMGQNKMHFKYDQMPYAISACDLIVLSNWGSEWDICGSGKVLEAAACGVPVICGDSPARREFFGNNYPLFHSGFNKKENLYSKTRVRVNFDDADELYKLIEHCIINKELMLKIGSELVVRANKHKPKQLAKKLKPIFDGIKQKGIS